MAALEPLAPDEIHLWLVDARTTLDPVLANAYRALLSADDRTLYERAKHPRRINEILVGRALIRTTLSRYAAVDPRAWRLAFNAHGCPRIDPPPDAPGLVFNLSHTEGLIACAVARAAELGVDVEWTHRGRSMLEIADRFFSSRELADLRALPEPARQEDRFFDLWTLKESYIKARGLGLSLPLEKFGFLLAPGSEPRLYVDPELGDDAASWRFFQLSPTDEHRAAVAVRGGPSKLVTRWTIPLAAGDAPPLALS